MKLRWLQSSLLIVTGGLLTACNDPTGLKEKVNVSLDQTSYQAGATVTVTVVNKSPDAVGDPANSCGYPALVLQRRSTNNQWNNVTSTTPSDTVCTLVAIMLQPGESRSIAFTLPGDLSPGTYRFTLYRGKVASPSFDVSS